MQRKNFNADAVASRILQQFQSTPNGRNLEDGACVSQSIICERAFTFAARIFKLSEKLWNRGPAARQIASQLMRCGPSIGANAEEAQDAQTKPDYAAKMSIARKESREVRYWLRLAIAVKAVTAEEVAWELKEVDELRAMIIQAIKTAQSNTSRGPQP